MQAPEHTLLTLRPSRVLVLRYYVGMVFLLVLTGLLWIFNSVVPSLGPISARTLTLAATALLLFLFIVMWALAEYKRASTRYEITDFRIVRKDGILRRNETIVPYRQLERVVLHQGILDRLLGIGTLVIDTGDDTVRISSVRDPQKVEQAIMSRMQTLQTMPGNR
ncbi:MAG: PH domain-containing protein [Methanobacteriota archaeon]|nr:MAG: PH domain-containing protein [Euryarchaeota archaeon]